MSARTVSEWLRAQSPGFLTDLLMARPDLAVPVPADLASLASRASTPPSARRAMEELTAFELEVLEAVAGAHLTNQSTDAKAIADAIGATKALTTEALSRLSDLVLIWGEPSRPLTGVLTTLPYGQPVREVMGPIAEERYGPAELEKVLSQLPPDELEVLRALRSHPVGTVRQPPRGRPGKPGDTVDESLPPTERLFARGLLAPLGGTTVQMPADVGVALRRFDKRGKELVRPVTLTGTPIEIRSVDSAAAIEAAEAVRRVTTILEAWGADPPAVLRTGGLGVRELKSAAKIADVDEATASILVEVAFAAGLIGPSDDVTPTWRPTPTFDAWRVQPLSVRWVGLADAWLDTDRVASRAGRKDAAGKSPNTLAPGIESVAARRVRRDSLEVLGEAAPGTPASATDISDVLSWRLPLRQSRFGIDLVTDTLAEAAILGVTGRGALTSFSRLILEGAKANETANLLDELMPPEVEHLVIQADLSALAPGPLSPEVHRELVLLADMESSGAASLWRFSAESVRRAFDAGRTAAEVHEFLARVSSTPVPQALTYLVDDVSRRHGALRAGGCGAYVRTDDATLLTEVVASARTSSLGLRLVAPTVAVTQANSSRLLEVLRSAGYAPMAEAADGAVLIGRSDLLRSPNPRRSPRASVRGLAREQAIATATRILEGDTSVQATVAKVGERLTDRSSAATLAFLHEALAEKRSVWIGFVGRDGLSKDGVYTPVFIGGGRVLANDGRTDHVLPLHLITGVAPLETERR